jgi:hypothetical protein
VKFDSLRRYLVLLLAVFSAGLLTSCGGGGATSTDNPPTGGLVDILPFDGTVYAGIPVTFTAVGGRPPYVVTSSEPSLLPFPGRISGNTFTVVPNNPGVVDADLEEDELPVRTVNMTIRDATGDQRTRPIQVAQNFLTGYGVFIQGSTCADADVQACAGGDSAVRMQATFAGNLFGNQAFRLEVLRGNFALRNPATGQVASAITLNSDHSGTVTGIITVPTGVPTQLAVLRVIHLPTGVYSDTVFVIDGTPPTSGSLTAIPSEFTFTGPLRGQCGTGFADFFVFDGVGPYTAVSSHPSIIVTPTSTTGRFTIRADRPDVCVNATIVVVDSLGGRATVNVTTEEGDVDPPTPADPPDLVAGPTSLTLACGASGSVTVVGGTGNYSANSTNPNTTATVSGNTVTITRAGPAGPGAGSQTATISITDGSQIVNVTATSPATCP